jgi:hypothetical protein
LHEGLQAGILAARPGPPDSPADARFADRLDLALKGMTMSRGRLAQEAGVDRCPVGRWVAGTVVPSALNREKVTAAIARRVPGCSLLDWERPCPGSPRAAGTGRRRRRRPHPARGSSFATR